MIARRLNVDAEANAIRAAAVSVAVNDSGTVAAPVQIAQGVPSAKMSAPNARQPGTFVNPYLVEVTGHTPSGRDRLKETIRSAGPTVGNSLRFQESA